MKISKLISGTIAVALAMSTVAPLSAAPLFPTNDSARNPSLDSDSAMPRADIVQYRERLDSGDRKVFVTPDGNRVIRREAPGNNRPPQRLQRDSRRDSPPSQRVERRDRAPDRRMERRDRRPSPPPQLNRRDDRRAPPHFRNRDDRRGPPPRIERRNGSAYFNGHRGFRHKRPGYRYYDGYWFPSAAFLLGAIIGGAASGPAYASGSWEDHVNWCYNRYRSYRERDNTFLGYDGYRRTCVSPYYR